MQKSLMTIAVLCGVVMVVCGITSAGELSGFVGGNSIGGFNLENEDFNGELGSLSFGLGGFGNGSIALKPELMLLKLNGPVLADLTPWIGYCRNSKTYQRTRMETKTRLVLVGCEVVEQEYEEEVQYEEVEFASGLAVGVMYDVWINNFGLELNVGKYIDGIGYYGVAKYKYKEYTLRLGYMDMPDIMHKGMMIGIGISW